MPHVNGIESHRSVPPLARRLATMRGVYNNAPVVHAPRPGRAPIKLALVELSREVTLWKALRDLGWADRALQNQPEVLAFVAMHNGFDDYREIPDEGTVLLPRPQAQTAVVRKVRKNPDFYIDAMATTSNGLAVWRKAFEVGTATPTTHVGIGLRRPGVISATRPDRGTSPISDPGRAVVTDTVVPGSQPVDAPDARITPRNLRTIGVLRGIHDKQDLPGTEITVQWSPPQQNTDGTPLVDLAGYKVYYGSTSRGYDTEIDVGNITNFTIHNLPTGTVYLAVTAYDLSGNESAFSNEATKLSP